jgi:hypothetical protein
MVRGIAWDHLPNRYEPRKEDLKKSDESNGEIVPHVFDFKKDSMDIGRRTAFGLVVSTNYSLVRDVSFITHTILLDWFNYWSLFWLGGSSA